MSFDWSEYLNLAQELAGQATTLPLKEAMHRSAISRAYYASYCLARNRLRDKEGLQIPPGSDAHNTVRYAFIGTCDKTRRQIGENLQRLRNARNKADYDDSVPRLPSMTTTALAQAQQVIAALKALP